MTNQQILAMTHMIGPIIIHTDRDLTPQGKRVAKVVKTDRGGRQLRWYVGGKVYQKMPVTGENVEKSRVWMEAA